MQEVVPANIRMTRELNLPAPRAEADVLAEVLALTTAPAFAAGFELGGNAAKGAETFKTMCASCHGESGKGDGPAADALAAELRATGVDAGLLDLPSDGAAAAAVVYDRLRAADSVRHVVLVGHLVEPDGLGRAVNDRLFRAAHGRVVSADATERDAVVERVRALIAP